MKRQKLPVRPYLVKYLQKDMEDGVLKFGRRVVRVERNSVKVREYFDKHRDSKYFIWVEMREASLYTLYGLQADLAETFRDTLFSVMAFAVKSGMKAKVAARDWLSSYNITDEEYDLDSAYRTWQRRKGQFLNPTVPVSKPKRQTSAPSHLPNQLKLFT